jgi:hypothetical protein
VYFFMGEREKQEEKKRNDHRQKIIHQPPPRVAPLGRERGDASVDRA